MALKVATSFVVSALLGSPRAEAFAPSFAVREVCMASTVVPPQGGRSSSSSHVRVLNIPRNEGKQAASSSTGASGLDSSALNFRTGDYYSSSTAAADSPAGSTQTRSPPPELGDRDPENLSDSMSWTCADDSSWRKRARQARRVAALGHEDWAGHPEMDGHIMADAVERSLHGPRTKRALDKLEIKASRKECQYRARQRVAAPIMDLVGMTAPLVFIVGISLIQNVP